MRVFCVDSARQSENAPGSDFQLPLTQGSTDFISGVPKNYGLVVLISVSLGVVSGLVLLFCGLFCLGRYAHTCTR